MTDHLNHECGIALIRLLKEPAYYLEKYKTPRYGLNKLWLLLEKQHNRGQDGAGILNIKLDLPAGTNYINRVRSTAPDALSDIFNRVLKSFPPANAPGMDNPAWYKTNVPFTGEVFLGHLRYGTYGKNGIVSCHPFLRQNNWMSRTLAVAGNFNLTNVNELFQLLVELGQHPKAKADTVTVLEKIGHFLDEENEDLYQKFKQEGFSKQEISPLIAENLDWGRILNRASKEWDGGYVIAGVSGPGDAFVMRDPNGIRPAFYYHDDEVVVVTSERPAIQTAFNVSLEEIREVSPGKALIIRKNGNIGEVECRPAGEKRSCSFERIYFSRGSDASIYRERQKLGELLVPRVAEAIENDFRNSVFSFIPNTAEVAFYGLVKGAEDYLVTRKVNQARESGKPIQLNDIRNLLEEKPRVEKIAIKDAKLRTFITNDEQRNDLVAHVYDITYGTLRPGKDNLVVIDDSIVRGTTLKNSILRILDRLGPKKIVFVSSAPQIRYPDCYGIDMAKIGDLIAFKAAIALIHERNMDDLLEETRARIVEELKKPVTEMRNVVMDVYAPFTEKETADKIAQLIRPSNIQAKVEMVFQSVEGLHEACPGHLGDWYFTGKYPTPGGNRVSNLAFLNFMEGKNIRAY